MCLVCAHYEDHKVHEVKPLKEVIDINEQMTGEMREKIEEVIRTIELGFFKLNA